MGAAVIVFLVALITGLQDDLIARTLGTQPHIVLRPPDDAARPVLRPAPGETVAAQVEKRAQRLRSIDGWQRALADAAATPGVIAVSPMASGPAFAARGSAQKSVALLGVEPERYARIVPVPAKMVAGRFRVAGEDAVIGVDLAKDLGASVGDKVRLSTAEGRTLVVTVAGIFDLGLRDLNRRWVIITLRSAQTLLDLAGGVTNIDLTVSDLFGAEAVAQHHRRAHRPGRRELDEDQRRAARRPARAERLLGDDPVLRRRRGGLRHLLGARRLRRAEVARDRHPARDGRLAPRGHDGLPDPGRASWRSPARCSAARSGPGRRWPSRPGRGSSTSGSAGSSTRPRSRGATAVGILAAIAPAWRAARLEPAAAIRFGG